MAKKPEQLLMRVGFFERSGMQGMVVHKCDNTREQLEGDRKR